MFGIHLWDEDKQKRDFHPLTDKDLYLDDVSGEDSSTSGSGVETDFDVASQMVSQ